MRGFAVISVRDLAIAAHCSVCEDITESKRTEKTLRESEEGVRRMAERLTEALGIMAQPFQHGHLCARSLAVETCLPF